MKDLRDLSEVGLRMSTDTDLPPGRLLVLGMELSGVDQPFVARAVVDSDAWYFTNTSSIPIDGLDTKLELGGRIVGYHFYNDHDTLPIILEGVRSTYDGPLALATDYMVFNVTPDDIRVRMAAIDEDIWPLPATREIVVEKDEQKTYGEFVKSGEWMMRDVLEKVWGDVNAKYGTDAQLPPAK